VTSDKQAGLPQLQARTPSLCPLFFGLRTQDSCLARLLKPHAWPQRKYYHCPQDTAVRVFISYSHDSAGNKDRAWDLRECLRQERQESSEFDLAGRPIQATGSLLGLLAEQFCTNSAITCSSAGMERQ
jgi:hypothetical protein